MYGRRGFGWCVLKRTCTETCVVQRNTSCLLLLGCATSDWGRSSLYMLPATAKHTYYQHQALLTHKQLTSQEVKSSSRHGREHIRLLGSIYPTHMPPTLIDTHWSHQTAGTGVPRKGRTPLTQHQQASQPCWTPNKATEALDRQQQLPQWLQLRKNQATCDLGAATTLFGVGAQRWRPCPHSCCCCSPMPGLPQPCPHQRQQQTHTCVTMHLPTAAQP